MLKRMMVAVLALAMVAAACGDDDGGGSLTEGETAIVDAIVTGMMDDADSDNPFSDSESARCFAVGMVQDLGVARLAEVKRPAARLALLTALASYQIDKDTIAAFRAQQPGDDKLIAATAWASFTAARRVGTWLYI